MNSFNMQGTQYTSAGCGLDKWVFVRKAICLRAQEAGELVLYFREYIKENVTFPLLL